EVISKNGISIFIDPPKSLLVERIQKSTNRPLFQNKKNIKKKVNELYELRKTIYKKSNYIISSNLKKETLSIIKLES
ncbi:MAG: shikimate kinase, partial [Marinoscillum sp.]